jgi:DnaJ-class molecular chaperone
MDKKSNNCYEILGIEPLAESSSIATTAKAKVEQINQAFRILNDPQQRELYDIQLVSKSTAENFYALFGIESDVDAVSLKAAARAKAIEIDKAFRILIDPEKRKIYDESLTRTTARSRRTKRYVNTIGSVSPRESIFKQWYARLADNLSTFETPSMQDIVIFILSLLFFVYMVSLFF